MQLRRLLIAAVLSMMFSATGWAQVPALEKGSMLLGGVAGVDFASQEDEDVWSVTVLPRVEYFVARGLAVGGQVGVTHTRQDDFTLTTLTFGPAATWYFVQSGRTHPYLRGSFEYSRISASASDETASAHVWTGAAGLLILLTDAVGVDGQLFVSRADNDAGFDAITRAGLRFGITAFVF